MRLSNEDGNANDDGSEKSHFWFIALFFFVRVIRVLFFPPWILWAENDGMCLNEAKQILRTFLLLRPCSPENSKKVFSRSNFGNNSLQMLSPMNSNVQLLYLLLFFAVGVV